MTIKDKNVDLDKLIGPWDDAYYNDVYNKNNPVFPNLLYYCVPKVCSSSIKEMIKIRDGEWSRCGENRKVIYKTYDGPKTRIMHVAKLNFYDKEKFFSFAFVRNPYDRLYSAYKMLKVLMRKQKTLNHVFESFDIFVEKVITGTYKDNHIKKQSFFVPVEYDPHVNFIGRFENFENDWLLLQEKINYKFANNIVKLQAKDYTTIIEKEGEFRPPKEMSGESLKKIQEFYRDDFINFGYDFDDHAGFKIT